MRNRLLVIIWLSVVSALFIKFSISFTHDWLEYFLQFKNKLSKDNRNRMRHTTVIYLAYSQYLPFSIQSIFSLQVLFLYKFYEYMEISFRFPPIIREGNQTYFVYLKTWKDLDFVLLLPHPLPLPFIFFFFSIHTLYTT